MNVLITGGAGFIGSHLAKKLSENNRVIVLERDSIPNKWVNNALEKSIRVKGDVLNLGLLRRILSDYQIDQVYHLAAAAVVSSAYRDPITTFKTNAVGTANILEAVRGLDPWLPVLIQSTDKVYGDNRMHMTENDPLMPTIGIYETSKATEDMIAGAFKLAYNMNIRTVRPCNCYGYDLTNRIIPNTIRECLSGNPPVLYEGQEKTIRQYIYVEDLVTALQLVMDQNIGGSDPAIFNVGTDDILTQEEVVRTICRFFGVEPRLTKKDKVIKEIQKQSVDWTKIKNLGWKPNYTFEKGIQETIDRFKTYGFARTPKLQAPTVVVSEEEKAQVHKQVNDLIAQVRESHKQQAAQHPYTKIIYCQATFSQDFQDTEKCVQRVSPYVDATIIAEPGDLTEAQKKSLIDQGCIVKTYTFKDDLPAMRNEYLTEAKKLDPYAWIVVSDPDELISEKTCKDLRQIIAAAEADGNNMIGLYAHDIWIDAEKMDDGEKQKEAPYRESGFWKYLLFKIAPDFRYEGVGHAGRVHETWYAPSLYRSAVHLTKEYYYEHRKSVMKIYRNAARNLFIGGSGDNLGDLNPTFVELHKITAALNIDTWPQFEAYMKKGNIDKPLYEFLGKHRSDSSYSWESEVRETFKWYFGMHPQENTGGWISEYTAPTPGSRADIENYVTNTYFEVLGRCPDELGKNYYVNAILSGRMQKDQLAGIFVNSDEYKSKFVSHLKDGVSLCIMGYQAALPMIQESIKVCAPYVQEIHVQGDDFNEEGIATLTNLGAKVHIEPWKDQFSDYKNKAISYAQTKWVLILDHDEIPTPALAEHIAPLVESSEKGNAYSLVSFISINQTVDAAGKGISESRGQGKALLHFNIKDPYYGNPHIWLKPNYYPWVGLQSIYAYRHVKEEGIDIQRAIRNVFLGGGGDNFRDKNPLWPELRQITNRLGITEYVPFLEYLKKGNIDPELKAWMEKAYVFPWHDQELKAFKEYYYKIHPEETPT
jgi:nucleoside-diphosphate-sugar epimerase/glycosyltransferase involved in cell wall biosynthesis